VAYTDKDGVAQSGIVNSVSTTTAGAATLTVGDHSGIDPSTITSVA
jgi:hypothetical protein